MSNANEHIRYASERCHELVEEAAALRESNFLSQREVSEALGLASHGNLASIESHKAVPRLDSFLRILSVMGYTLTITKK